MRELIYWDMIAHRLHVNFAGETPIDGDTMIFLYEAAEKENLRIVAFASNGIIVEELGPEIHGFIEEGYVWTLTKDKELFGIYSTEVNALLAGNNLKKRIAFENADFLVMPAKLDELNLDRNKKIIKRKL